MVQIENLHAAAAVNQQRWWERILVAVLIPTAAAAEKAFAKTHVEQLNIVEIVELLKQLKIQKMPNVDKLQDFMGNLPPFHENLVRFENSCV